MFKRNGRGDLNLIFLNRRIHILTIPVELIHTSTDSKHFTSTETIETCKKLILSTERKQSRNFVLKNLVTIYHVLRRFQEFV